MNNQMGVEIYIWTVPQENVQVQEMAPNASLLHDCGDGHGGCDHDDDGGGGGGDHNDLDESWVLD